MSNPELLIESCEAAKCKQNQMPYIGGDCFHKVGSTGFPYKTDWIEFPNQPLSFAQDKSSINCSLGVIRLQGNCSYIGPSTSGLLITIFNLPALFRPDFNITISVVRAKITTLTWDIIPVVIRDTGEVSINDSLVTPVTLDTGDQFFFCHSFIAKQ